jgi:hypothetical protein
MNFVVATAQNENDPEEASMPPPSMERGYFKHS